jgi:hypothetical protein
MKQTYFLFAFAFVLCVGTVQYQASPSKTSKNLVEMASQEDPDIISGILQSIPSPLEISQLIKEVSSDYSVSFLNASTSVSNYNTSYRQALNLGVYSTDLGYCNLYNKNQDILNYLSSVKKLANDLGIGKHFDYETIKRIANSKNNMDSLLNITQQNFEKINTHLREEKREYQSVLLLTGGWLEAVNLTTQVYKQTKTKGGTAAPAKLDKLKEKIGEQKLTLDQLMLVLDIYKTKPGFAELITDMKVLEKLYAKVQIVTVKSQPKQIIGKDGTPEFIDSSTSKVTISELELDAITAQIQAIRGKIVK